MTDHPNQPELFPAMYDVMHTHILHGIGKSRQSSLPCTIQHVGKTIDYNLLSIDTNAKLSWLI